MIRRIRTDFGAGNNPHDPEDSSGRELSHLGKMARGSLSHWPLHANGEAVYGPNGRPLYHRAERCRSSRETREVKAYPTLSE